MIKLLTGELLPQTGLVWKHSGLRVAYVAQHAFHYIENHLNKTANEYIRWRYESGEDKEGLEKVSMVATAEEEAKLHAPFVWEIKNDAGNCQVFLFARKLIIVTVLFCCRCRRQEGNPQDRSPDWQPPRYRQGARVRSRVGWSSHLAELVCSPQDSGEER